MVDRPGHHGDGSDRDSMAAALPIAIQEYVLAAWLILKGFTPGTSQPGPLAGQVPAGIQPG